MQTKKKFYFPIKPLPVALSAILILVYIAIFVINAFTPVLKDGLEAMPVGLRWTLAILFAAGFVFALYALFMIGYLVVKRRKPNAKFIVEAFTFLLAFALSWVLKAVVLAHDAGFEPTFPSIAQVVLSSFYASIGGLSFEGLAMECTMDGIFAICCYYGTSIVAGLVFISVIASHAAYEFYSFLLLLFMKTEGKDIYIFTALNDETLNLANSAMEKGNGPRDSLVIFSGSALEPFDRHDIRCAEVMAKGYVYWSISGRNEKPILKQLHLNKAKAKSVTVFAFVSDDDHIPDEEENMDYVLLDIHRRNEGMARANASRIAEAKAYIESLNGDKPYVGPFDPKALRREDASLPYARKKALRERGNAKAHIDTIHVAYYILTKRKVDYEAYQDKINELNREFEEVYRYVNDEALALYLQSLTEKDPKEKKRLSRLYRETFQRAMPFSVHVWNEAHAIADEAVSYLAACPDAYDHARPQTWVCSIGFGTMGQALAKALYIASSRVDGKGKADAFLCDVLDPAGATSYAALLAMEMPLGIVLAGNGDRNAAMKAYAAEKQKRLAAISGRYPYGDKTFMARLDGEFALPCFLCHDYGLGDARSFDLFGAKKAEKGFFDFSHEYPNYFTIAVGDDYANIRFTNALVAYLDGKKLEEPITIFVNVWDAKNNNLIDGFNRITAHRLNGTAQCLNINPMLRLVIVGNNEDIYSCSAILESAAAANYNRIYDEVASAVDYGEVERFNASAHAYFRDGTSSVALPGLVHHEASSLVGPWESTSQEDRDKAIVSWRCLSLWKRVSSLSSLSFGPFFAHWLKKQKGDEGAYFANLSRTEHQRWMRAHIVEGWDYAPDRDDGKRKHPCLLPCGDIDPGTLAYDLFNVLLAKK